MAKDPGDKSETPAEATGDAATAPASAAGGAGTDGSSGTAAGASPQDPIDGDNATAAGQTGDGGNAGTPSRGGAVSNVRPLQSRELDTARAAQYVAFALLGILAGTILLQYLVSSIILLRFTPTGDEKQLAAFKEIAVFVDRIFSALLPVLAGLVGSAVTYYFAKEGRK